MKEAVPALLPSSHVSGDDLSFFFLQWSRRPMCRQAGRCLPPVLHHCFGKGWGHVLSRLSLSRPSPCMSPVSLQQEVACQAVMPSARHTAAQEGSEMRQRQDGEGRIRKRRRAQSVCLSVCLFHTKCLVCSQKSNKFPRNGESPLPCAKSLSLSIPLSP